MKLKIDTAKCSGIGLCEMTAPAVYEVGDDGQSHVLKEQASDDEMPAVKEAIASCPTGALSIDD